MRNAGDAFPLQKGCLAHQRPGGKKEHPPPAPFHQPRQNMRCQHCSTAPGPAAARLHVLGGNIIQQASAVLVVLHRTISFVHQLMQQGAANFTQITGKNGVKVLLTDMVMVNISKSFYHLRRVSANGLADDIDLCGQETSNNYVVDTDAREKNGNVGETYKGNYFYNNFFARSVAEWENKFTKISSLTEEDNDESWNTGNRNGYKIWRYATENTIPAPNSNQKNGISTGVIFKGKLQFNKSTYGVTGDQPIFVYNNVLYGTWEKVKDVANAANADESLRAAYAQIGETPAADAEFGKAGFTVLRPNGSGDYEMYYCYWNRHNDNNDPNLMGPMEFAVVRNNVYKLMVNKINGYGHPTSPGPKDDPDPFDPNNPDERNDLYIEVTVEVRPWVVRINDIEF